MSEHTDWEGRRPHTHSICKQAFRRLPCLEQYQKMTEVIQGPLSQASDKAGLTLS